MTTKKEQNRGSIAIPFLMTMLVTLVLLGGAAFFFLDKLLDEDNNSSTSGNFSPVYKPDADSSRTLLAVFDNGSLETDLDFVIIGTMPSELKIISMMVPVTTTVTLDGETTSLAAVYRSGGITALRDSIESVFGIEIDKHARLDALALERVHSILGGVTANVPQGIADMPSGKTGLNAEQFIMLLTYPNYSAGERYRTTFASSTFSTMLNYGLRESLVSRLDMSFDSLIDLISTDITALDYRNDKSAFAYLLENRINDVQIRIIPGAWNENAFTPSDTASEQIKTWFEVDG